MQHYVLVKFRPGYISEDKIDQIKRAYAQIEAGIEGIQEIRVERNCIDRETNMDLMIRVSLTEEAILSEYLSYPAHLKIARDMEPYVLNRVSFDYR